MCRPTDAPPSGHAVSAGVGNDTDVITETVAGRIIHLMANGPTNDRGNGSRGSKACTGLTITHWCVRTVMGWTRRGSTFSWIVKPQGATDPLATAPEAADDGPWVGLGVVWPYTDTRTLRLILSVITSSNSPRELMVVGEQRGRQELCRHYKSGCSCILWKINLYIILFYK